MVEVAYNLENFAAKTAEQHDTELKTRSLRIIKNRRKTKVIAPVKVILASAMAIVISIVMIYSQVEYVNLTGDDQISVARTGGKYLIKENWDNFVNFIAEYLNF